MTPWSTPDLCDAFPQQVHVVVGLTTPFQSFGGREVFCGEIVTVKCHEDNSLVKSLLATPGQDRVLVVDGGGSMRCALMGDLIADSAVKNDWAGVVIYGCVRDVQELSKFDIGIQALGAIPIKSIRQNRGDQGLAVTFGGVTFSPGQHLYADLNGIVVSNEVLTL